MRTEYVDETWGSVAARRDLDDVTTITLEFNREADDLDNGHERIEFVMSPQLAKRVARSLNAAVRLLT